MLAVVLYSAIGDRFTAAIDKHLNLQTPKISPDEFRTLRSNMTLAHNPLRFGIAARMHKEAKRWAKSKIRFLAFEGCYARNLIPLEEGRVERIFIATARSSFIVSYQICAYAAR